MKKYALLALITALGYQSFAQAKLVEKVEKKGDAVVIPYSKYVLPNGLTVVVHEDHSDPIVHVDVTYHVGSAREEINKSGFAHFFEHMMFQGSDNVGDEQHFKIITEAGGTLNGTTNRDRTNYFETVPANQLEKMLWLEADRMGFLLDAVTQEKFEVQRATVKNERGQNYDNRPYGLVGEVAAKNLYPYGHPYSWLTIGYVEDLNRVNVNDLKNFFLRWYGPNNAVLTVGGDVNAADVVKLAEKYFGSIPRGPEVNPVVLSMPELSSDRYVSMTDNYAKLPMLRMVYPTSPSFSKDEPALDCLAEIIGQGKNSIFYKNFVKAEKAVNASLYNSTTELAGEFTISIIPYPGQTLADMEKIVRESLAEFEKRGVTDDDILKFRNSAESQTVYGLESVSGKVSQLASFYTFTGNPNWIGEYLKRYTSVTKDDVMSVYNRYIKGQHAVIVSVLTKAGGAPAAADNYTVDASAYKAPNYGYDGLKYHKAKDNFDRSKMPSQDKAVVINVPKVWKSNIGTAKAIGTESQEIPTVNIFLSFKGGQMVEPVAKNGLASLFADMMNEGTKNYSAEAFDLALDQLGSSINVSSSTDKTQIQVKALTKNLDKTLALLQERILNTVFTQEDFGRIKKQTIESAQNALNRPAYVASLVFDKMVYGVTTPYGLPGSGSASSIEQITLQDIQDYYKNYFSNSEAEIVVVGDVKEKDILSKLNFINKMNSNAVNVPSPNNFPSLATQKTIYLVNVPGAAQTEFRIGKISNMKYDALGEYYRSNIMNFPLGGAFNSRLNLYLREEKGWTYGARSGFSGDEYTGRYTFSAGIKAAPTDSALVDVLRIIETYRNGGMTADELAFTKSSMTQSEARQYETGGQKAGFLSRMLSYNLPENYTTQQNALLNKLTVDEMKALAKKNLYPENEMLILLVGDKEKLQPKLKALGYSIIELDSEGNKL